MLGINGQKDADSFRTELHFNFKGDLIFANYAWIQHFIHHLSPVSVAEYVLANGSMSTQIGIEGDIRSSFQYSFHQSMYASIAT